MAVFGTASKRWRSESVMGVRELGFQKRERHQNGKQPLQIDSGFSMNKLCPSRGWLVAESTLVTNLKPHL